MGNTEDLARDLGVDERDVHVLLSQLGEQTPDDQHADEIECHDTIGQRRPAQQPDERELR